MSEIQILTKQSGENEIRSYFNAILELSNLDNEFPVSLDNVWMLVYGRKEEAVRALTTSELFLKDVDYQVLRKNAENPKGGRPTFEYFLSISCMEFFIARKVRPVFEVYRQVFHKVANSVRSSEPVLTSSFDISNLTGRPHPTIMKDIRKILEQGAGADDFFKTYRPVETECGTRDYEAYNITPKGLLILSTGYAPLLRDRIAARFMEIVRGGNMETGIRPMPNPSCGNVPERMMPDYAKEYERRNAELWRIIEEKNRIIDGLKAGRQTAGELSPLPEDKPQRHETAAGRFKLPSARPHYPGTYLVNDMRCALMNERGICLRSRDIFRWLRREGWICSDGNAYNKPSEMAVRNGWMLPAVGNGKRNTDKSHFTPRLTESGYRTFVDTVMKKGGVL